MCDKVADSVPVISVSQGIAQQVSHISPTLHSLISRVSCVWQASKDIRRMGSTRQGGSHLVGDKPAQNHSCRDNTLTATQLPSGITSAVQRGQMPVSQEAAAHLGSQAG